MDDSTQPVNGGGDTEWLMPNAAPDELQHGDPDAKRRPVGVAVALVAVGALAGAVAVSLLHNNASNRPSTALPAAATANGGSAPGGQQGLGAYGDRDGDHRGDGFGGPGGLAGEQHLSGTLTAVGSSSVTVKTSSGTATYTVTGSTQIVRNGAAATLSQLRVGDPVFVHVYRSPSGGAMLLERIFAGTMPTYDGRPGDPSGTGTWRDHDGRTDDGRGPSTT